MKRTISLLIIATMLLGLASCSKEEVQETTVVTTTTTVEQTTTTAETEPPVPTGEPVTGVYELFEADTMFEVVEEATVYSDVSVQEIVTTLPVGGMVVCIATHGDYIVTDSGYYIYNTALKEFQVE